MYSQNITGQKNIEFNAHKVAIMAQGKLHELYELGLPGADAIALYTFYYYTSNWQKTRQVKATGKYCWTKLGWSNRRFYQAKRILAEKGLIIEVQKSQKGVFSEVYIKLPYKATEATTASVLEHYRTADVLDRTAVQNTTNTLSVDKLNTLSVDNKEEKEGEIFSHNNVISTTTTDATNVNEFIELPPAPHDSTLTVSNGDVKNLVTRWKKHTGLTEAISEETRDNIKTLWNKYGKENIATAIENTDTYDEKYLPYRRLAKIFKNEENFLKAYNRKGIQSKNEEITIKHENENLII